MAIDRVAYLHYVQPTTVCPVSNLVVYSMLEAFLISFSNPAVSGVVAFSCGLIVCWISFWSYS
ncbi:hypothetical protein BJ742DRAFT_810751 [Cladochytrium replicatum]|nr:hypothetical protein BJ742DRAFT_810751 [Cladochytrium replicatum]